MPIAKRDLKPHHRAMIEDGFPPSLLFTDAERRAAWKDFVPREQPRPDAVSSFRRLDAIIAEEKAEKAAAREAEKAARKPEPRLPRFEIRASLVDAAAVAKEFDIEPRELRAMLRKRKYPKPAWGWAFNEAQLADVRALISKETGRDGKTQGGRQGEGRKAQRAAREAGDGADTRRDGQHRRADQKARRAPRKR